MHLAGKHPSRQLSLSWYYSDGARLNASIGPVNMHTSLASSESCNFEGLYAVTELNTASGFKFLLFFFVLTKNFASIRIRKNNE